jgi:hypothetical protein
MNEIDQLRDLWGRVEDRADKATSPPADLTRRVRLRQAVTAGLAVTMVVAAAGLSWAGIRWADRTFVGGPGRGVPIAGPSSPSPSSPSVTPGDDVVAIVPDPSGSDAAVGPSELDPPPDDAWRPISEPVFLGGEEAFDAVWRMYAWEAPTAFVGWHDIETASGEHIVAGGTLMTLVAPSGSCRLVPQMADLEIEDTPDVRRWLLYGYITPDVASVEITLGDQRLTPTILRVPYAVGAPFDMYALPVSGVSVTQQNDIALGTVIRDAEGRELDRGPLEHCLGLA